MYNIELLIEHYGLKDTIEHLEDMPLYTKAIAAYASHNNLDTLSIDKFMEELLVFDKNVDESLKQKLITSIKFAIDTLILSYLNKENKELYLTDDGILTIRETNNKVKDILNFNYNQKLRFVMKKAFNIIKKGD